MDSIPNGIPRQLSRAWLWLGLAALIGSGLLAILLVFSRTPGFQDFFPLRNFFRSALIVHVDLSVAIWFMALAALLWSTVGGTRLALLSRAGLWLAALGTVLMTVSPFFPDAQPLLNNYIPVLQHPVFYASLVLCGAGFGLVLVRALITGQALASPLHLGLWLGALAGALAWFCFAASWIALPTATDHVYFERLFWAGGHTLQFQHALLMLVAWFWMARELALLPRQASAAHGALFVLAALPLLVAPYLVLTTAAGSPEQMGGFAKLMIYGHMAMLPLMALIVPALWRGRGLADPVKSALWASFVLFTVGGVLGHMIQGVNVVIPAHYHGSIVGVTLAFMGMAYVLLPQLGYRAVEGGLARWQPYVYGGGQLLHILGLAWSGGYGVQRKVAGAEQVLTSLPQKIGMGMMGLGGFIAIIGGLLFVVVCLKAMRGKAR
ncbi:cbb3-type cytochrome c oxidase subunit I [Denitratisoma sp. DHT3]|uniref:cbb3-type cytochrome c oxidase subunit I n=1 Tax=Denitratisoma sp. DHT3 TaxID=1981880 RepID=UPI0016482054|nr:cbb3-type cytochrome c oxidase subunit I [Denitratisoma sp. DHT3]